MHGAQRLFAAIKPGGPPPLTQHYVGLPVALGGRAEERHQLPRAALVLIEPRDDGVFLYRYSGAGESGGDTWHANVEEAKGQAAFEFGESLAPWQPVPDSIVDAHEFAVRRSQAQ